ncbi:phage-related tail fiber protein-like protein [Enterobacter hormaechei]|nr:hypothetical protein [Enterobacter hormaechei]VAL08699.1 phage-related tail fiber protein-like protein [Enterobacter hormaechei]
MSNLPETPQWQDGIYQIETSDPVLGGPDGISNRQAKQLASRTSYLKQQVEKGGSDLAAHIAATDPHTQYAPKASPTFTGTPTAPTPAANDNSKKLVTTEFVARAIATLAGTAPETLDTLKELADALGNDPNFATTVLNKLAEKLAKDQNGADIPDPAIFVKNLGLNAFHSDKNFTSMSSPTAKTFMFITDSGGWGAQDSHGTPLSLPMASGGTGANSKLGSRVALGISAFGSDGNISSMASPDASRALLITNGDDWGAQKSDGTVIPLPVARGGLGSNTPAGGRANLGLGTTATKTVGTGAGQIPDMSAFGASATSKGYMKFPNGLILQWGVFKVPAANAGGDYSIDQCQIPFPNGIICCLASGSDTSTDTPCFASAEAISNQQIRIKAVAVNLPNKTITQGMLVSGTWFAIGA